MKFAIFAIVPLILMFLAVPVNAGISLGTGGITVPAGQTEEMCDVWIFATQDGGKYHVDTTGDLKDYTVEVTPNDFELDPIDCPDESFARRACIESICRSSDQNSCKKVCVKFNSPSLMEWNPTKVVLTGAIVNEMKIGAATVKEPYQFSLHVEPMDLKPVFVAVIALIIVVVIAVAVFVNKRRKKQ
jgi:hypothetical protein